MRTLKLDEDGDLIFDDQHNLVMLVDEDEILQSLYLLLATNQKEWFLKPGFGLAYGEIMGRKQWRDEEAIKDAITMTLRQEPRVSKILSLSTRFDQATRVLQVDFSLVTTKGQQVDNTVEVVW